MDRWKFVNEKWIPRPVSRGEGFVSGIAASPSNLRPFGAPPSIGRREYPRKPLPLEGAAERSEAGLASFFLRRSRLLFAFPIGEGGPRQRRSGAFVNGVLETIFPDLFSYRFPHPPSAPSGHLLPSEGGSVHPSPFLWKGLPSAARRGWLPFLRPSRLLFAFPMQGKRCYPCAIIHKQPCPYEGKPKRRREHPAPL